MTPKPPPMPIKFPTPALDRLYAALCGDKKKEEKGHNASR